MKKFIAVLSLLIFIGATGKMIEKAGAKMKSDDKALAIIAQARQAIGGDAAIGIVQSLTVNAHVEQILTFDAAPRIEQGELEINLELPSHFSKMIRLGNPGANENVDVVRQVEKVVIIKKDGQTEKNIPADVENVIIARPGEKGKFIIKESDENTDGGDQKLVKKIIVKHSDSPNSGNVRQNEMFRMTFALLLSAPEGVDVSYIYAGDSSVDGSACDLISVEQNSVSAFQVCFDKSSHLPLEMTFQGHKPLFINVGKQESGAVKTTEKRVIIITKDGPKDAAVSNVEVVNGNGDEPDATAEYKVKFSNYHTVNGVNLPHKWTQTVAGQTDQTINVSAFEINPANIADKFK